MVDWMVEVTSVFKCTERTFFLAVAIMDSYYGKRKEALPEEDLHLTGVTCMFLASKYEDIEHITMSALVKRIAHDCFTKEQVKAKEKDILRTLGMSLHLLLSFDFIHNFSLCFRTHTPAEEES